MIRANSITVIPKFFIVGMSALALVACSSSDDEDSSSTPESTPISTPISTSEVTFVVPLSAANEIPAIVLPASKGEGNLVLDNTTGALSGSVSVSDLSGPAIMAHIHQAPATENGPVIITLEPNENASVWSVPADTVLDTAQLAEFLAGNTYLNVHTAANTGGEIRGQIRETTSFTVRIDNVSTTETLTTSTGSVAVPLSPGAYLVHRAETNPLLEPRDVANAALEAVAEDGNASLYPTTVPGSLVFNTPIGESDPGPITPGGYYSFSFLASPGDSLAILTMFVQSNDWFYSTTNDTNDSIALFDENGEAISGDVSSMLSLWESGTEADEEPGTGVNQAPRQAGPNTGTDEAEGVGSLLSKGKSISLNGDVIRVTITPGG